MTARSEAIERAARALFAYEETGAPDFPEWDAHYEALRAALAATEVGGRKALVCGGCGQVVEGDCPCHEPTPATGERGGAA